MQNINLLIVKNSVLILTSFVLLIIFYTLEQLRFNILFRVNLHTLFFKTVDSVWDDLRPIRNSLLRTVSCSGYLSLESLVACVSFPMLQRDCGRN